MSDYLAISAVTATFQRVLQTSVQETVYGARVTAARPNTLENGPLETGVNLYLFLITPNSAFRHNDPIGRRPVGNLVKRSQTAYDLQYLVSFHGSEAEYEPEKLFGSVTRTIQEVLTLTPDMIRDTLSQPSLQTLSSCDLAEQVEPVRIFPTEISLENLSKIWSVFFQTPYSLSAIYKATVILIDGTEPGQRSLPVRDQMPTAVPFTRLQIQQIVSSAGVSEPILTDSTLIIKGISLYHPQAQVRIGGVDITPSEISATRISLPLSQLPSSALRAGIQTAQIVHPHRNRSDGTSHNLTSNLQPFVVRPSILQTAVSNIRPDGRNTFSAEVTIHFDVEVGAAQRAVLILNAWSKERTQSYLYKAHSRHETSREVTFKVEKVEAGEYLVRAQIDDAESLLAYDSDRNSDTFEWYISPRLTV